MADTAASLKLTIDGAMKLLNAAMAKARDMKVPECIAIVDPGGHLLAFARMDGAFALSFDTALVKAMTAASYGIPTGDIPAGIDIKLAIATQGKRVNLPGRSSSMVMWSAASASAPAPVKRTARSRMRRWVRLRARRRSSSAASPQAPSSGYRIAVT